MAEAIYTNFLPGNDNHDLGAVVDALEKDQVDRRPPSVSLPRVSILTGLDATPERLAHANDNHVVEDDGEARRRRMVDSPIETMLRRGVLGANGETLFAAARRYYSDWYASGLSGPGAIDYSKPFVEGQGPASAIPITERAAIHRDHFRRARDVLGPRLAKIVDAVVLEERGLKELGEAGFASGRREKRIMLIKEQLVSGLRTLWTHYSTPIPRQIRVLKRAA